MTRLHKLTYVLFGLCAITAIVACQSDADTACPDGVCLEEKSEQIQTSTQQVTEKVSVVKEDAVALKEDIKETKEEAVEEFEEIKEDVKEEIKEEVNEIKEEIQEQQESISEEIESTAEEIEEKFEEQKEELQDMQKQIPEENRNINPDDFVYLTAPNGKGSAYCPKDANSLAWNGVQYKCCGKGLKSVEVASREDSICCPKTSSAARWVGKNVFDYECCPEGTVEVKNEGVGDKYVCCPAGQIAKDGVCLIKEEIRKDGKVLMTAVGNKGQAFCPDNANSLAWNAVEFECCGEGMKATLIPSRGDSICCPANTIHARWVGRKWNDFECCPAGLYETKNVGIGPKYICCPNGNRALNGECLEVR